MNAGEDRCNERVTIESERILRSGIASRVEGNLRFAPAVWRGRRMGVARKLGFGFVLVLLAIAGLRTPQANVEIEARASREFWSRDGQMLEIRPNSAGQRLMRRSSAEFSPEIEAAFLFAEDQRFREHHGLDARALARLAIPSKRRAGVSTITMQLARLRYRQPRTVAVKFDELLLAMRLERDLSKDQILEQYLNLVPLGRGTEGVEAASWAYFAHSAKSATRAEATFLAALAPAPSVRGSNRDAACAAFHRLAARRGVVEECPATSDFKWPQTGWHAANLGLTIDSKIQKIAESSLANSRQRLLLDDVHDGSVVVVDSASRSIVALVGSRGLSTKRGFVNGATAWRQAGSVLKPFLYELYFESGHGPDEELLDAPRCFREASELFCPENNSRFFIGKTTPHHALASSLNAPAVAVLEGIGVERYLQRLRDLGLVVDATAASQVGLGLALGDTETNLVAVTTAFDALTHRETGASLAVLSALRDVDARRPGFGSLASSIPASIAYKTGTSALGRDLWAVGSDGNFTVGIWLGNFDGQPTSAMALTSAAPLMKDVFQQLESGGGMR